MRNAVLNMCCEQSVTTYPIGQQIVSDSVKRLLALLSFPCHLLLESILPLALCQAMDDHAHYLAASAGSGHDCGY
jgi:hypothetical protein